MRAALSQADAAAVIWVASRAISFMDENAFPEAVEPWLVERCERPGLALPLPEEDAER